MLRNQINIIETTSPISSRDIFERATKEMKIDHQIFQFELV